MLIRSISELLPYNAGAITCVERSYCLLHLGIRAFQVFQMIVLVAVGSIVRKGGIRAEAFSIDIKIDTLGQYAMPTDFCRIGNAHQIVGRLVGNDVDNASNGITSVK